MESLGRCGSLALTRLGPQFLIVLCSEEIIIKNLFPTQSIVSGVSSPQRLLALTEKGRVEPPRMKSMSKLNGRHRDGNLKMREEG